MTKSKISLKAGKLLILVILLLVALPIIVSLPNYALAQVDTAWVRRYNGPANGDDRPAGITVDGSGNVYVTGTSKGSDLEMDYDYATIKYDPNGNELWVRRYNGQANDQDWANGIGVDGFGNVYVTGTARDTAIFCDTFPIDTLIWCDTIMIWEYATLKYYPDGGTAWLRTYRGAGSGFWPPVGSDACAYVIAVDGHGNVYTTGWSLFDTVTGPDYTTIKYYPDGNTAWIRTYSGPGLYGDMASAMAVDGSGNVCVTGFSQTYSDSIHWYSDFATVKYDFAGNQLWARTYGPLDGYNGANAIAVDNSGNVYVTGCSIGSGTGYDYATIKYYPNGGTAWIQRYNGPGNSDDGALAIAVDDSGNVFVTGSSGTIKYDAEGNQLWLDSLRGSDIALDSANNVYVTGAVTRKYDSDGNQLWVGSWGGSYITLDSSNNVYVAGSIWNGTAYDYVTIKYVQYTESLNVYDPGTGDKLILSWHPSSLSNLLGYNIYRSVTSGGPYDKVNATLVTDTVYLDEGLQLNTHYHYYVETEDASWGEFRYTEEDSGVARYPVVLVHGLNSDNATWVTMKSYLKNDRFEHVWAPKLDGWGGHQKNATNLNTFIEAQKDSVRDFIQSTYGFSDIRPNVINLIGHSMGGIISRFYVHNFNQNVDHLIMLGTPNGGNRSADFIASKGDFVCDAIRELTTWFMRIVFDMWWRIDNVPGVHYHEVAGDYPLGNLFGKYVYSPNDPWPNDMVVSVSSVFHSPAEDQEKTWIYHDNHFTINENQETYERCIYPWLMGSDAPQCESANENYLAYHSSNEDDTLEQFLPTHLDSIFPAESKQHALIVDSCEVARLGISWFSGNLDVVLYDPYGTLIDSAYAENNDSVARGCVEENGSYRMEFYAIAHPTPGNWTLEVRGVSVSDSGEKYWIEGIVESNLRLVGRMDSDFYSPNDTVIITGELRRDTVAIVGADVSATINKPDDSFEGLALFDDGLHHDGQANDGVYANIFTNTSLYGSYGVSITASGSLRNTTFSRESFFGFVVSEVVFMRGDANGDGVINVTDVVYLINYLFIHGPAPDPIQAGDVNCDGVVNVTDVVYLINYLFISGPPPEC